MENFELLYNKYFNTSITNSQYIFLPHAHINYSGFCAYVALRSVEWSNVKTIVLLSTNHFLNQNITIDQEYHISDTITLEPFEYLDRVSFDIINNEHSWLFLIPLFEYFSKKISIKMILARTYDTNLSKNIEKFMKKNQNSILIGNSDLSHSNGHFNTKLIPSCPNVLYQDMETINTLLFQNDKCSETACGIGVIEIFKDIVLSVQDLSPRLMCYYNSNNDTLIKNIQNGDFNINLLFDCVSNQKTAVGYAALIYIDKKKNSSIDKLFSPYEQYYLTMMCRTIITTKKYPTNYFKLDNLTVNKALFVTITLNNKLRGCIGTLQNNESIFNNIYKYAIASAFQDSRFEPMNNIEIRDCRLFITLLEQKNRLENGLSQYMKEYSIGNDGIELVINKKHSAFFLPSVGEDMIKDGLPSHEVKIRLLELLCKKSGLSNDKCYLNKTDFYINMGVKLFSI